jgi:hypothetical protein
MYTQDRIDQAIRTIESQTKLRYNSTPRQQKNGTISFTSKNGKHLWTIHTNGYVRYTEITGDRYTGLMKNGYQLNPVIRIKDKNYCDGFRVVRDLNLTLEQQVEIVIRRANKRYRDRKLK